MKIDSKKSKKLKKLTVSKTKARAVVIRPTYPERSSEVFVTQKMLFGVRDELVDLVKSVEHGLRSEIHGVKAEIHEVKSEVKGLSSQVHRLSVLIEEQNARNTIVLDGLTNLFTRQDRLEHQWSDFQKTK